MRLLSVVVLACVAPVASLGLSTTLAAQAPADRDAIDTFRDSLVSIHDTVGLLQVTLREKNAHPTTGDKELQRLRYGWALTRLGEMTDSAPPLIDALLQFREGYIRKGNWPYTWFGLGAAKIALDDIGAPEVRSNDQPAGTGWRYGAADAFLHAVQRDNAYVPAAVELGTTVLRTPTWVKYTPVIDALTRAAHAGQGGVEVWLVLGRVFRQADSTERALQAFDTYVSQPGVDLSVGQLERARSLFALGRNEEGTLAYYRGAADPSPAARKLYRKDLSWIADSAALAKFDSTAGADLPAMLADFWHQRETESGRPNGTRLPDHYKRWDIAERRYKLYPALQQQWDFGQIYRTMESDVDDRGVVYIRHGEPDDKATFIHEGIPPNESWAYHRPGHDLLLHFVQSLTASGWRLVDGLSQLATSPCQIPGLLDSRAALDPMYQRFADAARQDSFNLGQAASHGDQMALRFFAACNPQGVSAAQAQAAVVAAGASGASLRYFDSHSQDVERQASRRDIRAITSTDTDPLRFRAQYQPIVQAYGVGGTRPGNGKLLIVWAIAGRDHPRADTIPGVNGPVYSVRIRANITDSTGKLIVGIDSVRRYHTAAPIPDGNNSYLPGLLLVDVPSGTYRVQLSVADTVGDKGALRVLGGIPVPAFAGPAEMSDLVLGLEGEPLAWNRAGTRFALNPRFAWTPDQSMSVGFELAGLPPGSAYKVRIGISDLGADTTRPARASVEFENQASGGREFISQELGLRALKPGRYLLTATITSGATVLHRERRITIAGS